MATTYTSHTTSPTDDEFGKLRDLHGRFLAKTLKASKMYLYSSEKAVEDVLELELKFVRQTEQQWLRGEYDWLKSLIEAHTGLTRELTHTYTDAVRQLVGPPPSRLTSSGDPTANDLITYTATRTADHVRFRFHLHAPDLQQPPRQLDRRLGGRVQLPHGCPGRRAHPRTNFARRPALGGAGHSQPAAHLDAAERDRVRGAARTTARFHDVA